MQLDAADVRSVRLAGCDLAPSAPGTAKWRSRPSKKRHSKGSRVRGGALSLARHDAEPAYGPLAALEPAVD